MNVEVDVVDGITFTSYPSLEAMMAASREDEAKRRKREGDGDTRRKRAEESKDKKVARLSKRRRREVAEVAQEVIAGEEVEVEVAAEAKVKVKEEEEEEKRKEDEPRLPASSSGGSPRRNPHRLAKAVANIYLEDLYGGNTV